MMGSNKCQIFGHDICQDGNQTLTLGEKIGETQMTTELPLVIVPLLGLPLLALVGIHMALDETLLGVSRLVGLFLALPALILEHVLVIFLWPALAQCLPCP